MIPVCHLSFLTFLFIFLFNFQAYAGGPFQVTGAGQPSVWTTMPIDLHPETGDCGSISNAEMITRLETNTDQWDAITSSALTFNIVQGSINVDVTGSNYNTYFVDSVSDTGATDGLNPVVFDNDGAIVDAIFGIGSQFRTLGFAGPDIFSNDLSTIQGGQAFFNCKCAPGNTCPGNVTFSSDEINFTMTHEIGHLIGLDHTQVNSASASDCNIAITGDCDLPTMYPVSIDAEDQNSPTRDDEVAVLTLYGLTSLTNNFVTLTGTILNSSGAAVRCADVQAIPADPAETIAVVSGAFAANTDLTDDGYTDDPGECTATGTGCGDFILRGLDPSLAYTIRVEPIDTDFTAGSGIGPCTNTPNTNVVSEEIGTVAASSSTAGSTATLGAITSNTPSTSSAAKSSESLPSLLLMALGMLARVRWKKTSH